jgi:hypothetical protein
MLRNAIKTSPIRLGSGRAAKNMSDSALNAITLPLQAVNLHIMSLNGNRMTIRER